MRWNNLGLKALARDWTAWPETPSNDLMLRSQFNLFREIGVHLYGRSSECAAICNGLRAFLSTFGGPKK
jgi:hypothetical protein